MRNRATTQSDRLAVQPRRLHVAPTPSPLAVAQQRLARAIATEVSMRAHLVDGEWILDEIAEAGERYGWSTTELDGTRLLDLVVPEDRLRAQHTLASITGSPSAPARLSLLTASGEPCVMAISGLLAEGLDGSTMLVLLARDVTEQARLEGALAEGDLAHRVLGDAAANQVFFRLRPDADRHWVIEDVSKYGQGFGWCAETVAGLAFSDLVHPHDVAAVAAAEALSLGTFVTQHLQARLRTGDGEYRWMRLRASRMPATGGEGEGAYWTAADVHEGVMRRLALEAAEQERRHLLETAVDLTVRTGSLGHGEPWRVEDVVDLTGAFGWASGDLIGGSLLDVIHADDRCALQEAVPAVLGGGIRTTRVRVRTHGGSYLWSEVTQRASFDVATEAVVVHSLFRDVDAEVCRQQELAETAAQQRVLLENSIDVVFRLRLDRSADRWAVEHVSDPGTSYGWTTEPDGVWLSDLVHAEDIASVRRTLDALAGGEVSRRVTLRLLTGDGSYVWMATTAVAVQPPNGRGPWTVYVLARDINDQVEAQRRLADSERRFRVTQHRAPIPLLELSPEAKILSVNAAACAFFGRTALELLNADFLTLSHADDAALDAADRERTLRGEADGYRTSKRFVRPDGTLRWGDLSVGVVRDRDERVERLVAQVLDVTEARQMAAELEHRSLHDALTGLANRELLLDHLSSAIARQKRTGSHIAVMFVDLDHFKLVNDTFGHAAGDLVLRTVAERLHDACRESDTVGRLGGDEFVVVAEGLASPQDAFDLADRLMDVVGHPLSVEGQAYVPSISVGMTTSASGMRSGAELLRDADTALYRAKERGRGRWELFDTALRVRAGQKLAGEKTLRSALSEENGLAVRAEYQPVVDLASGEVVGLEALARVQREGKTALEPDAFIPIAEDHGLITRLGTRMLTRALERLADARTPGQRQQWISVNVSPIELADPDYNRSLQYWLSVFRVDPTNLILEITERSLLSTTAASVRRLHEIADLGVRLALDDFGTGNTSLRSLHDLPISVVKLDRSLIGKVESDAAERSMSAMLADMTTQLGLMGIVEGIETRGQLEILRAQGWQLGQGFLFSAP